MTYNLLICTSSKYWMAVDIDEFDNCDRISLEGNEQMGIRSCEDISTFCSYILNYYNIKKFSEIPLNVKIVVLGNYSDLISELFQMLKNSNEVNIIDAKSILPILVLKKNVLKPGDCVKVECLGEIFSIKIMDNYKVSFEEISIEKRLLIEPEEFVLLYQFDCSNLFSDEKEKKELVEKYQNKVAQIQKELSETGDAYQKLQEEHQKLKEEYVNYRKGIVESEEALKARRTIVGFNENKNISIDDDGRRDVRHAFEAGIQKMFIKKCTCKLSYQDGEFVSDKDKIMQIDKVDVFDDTVQYELNAPCSGRVFYLVKDGQNIEGNCAVAIITDPSDTREAVMKWYEKMK